MTRRVVVITPRMLTKDQAAQYCGVSITAFIRICPVRPASMGDDARLLRYDTKLLDVWLDALGFDQSVPGQPNVRSQSAQRGFHETNLLPGLLDPSIAMKRHRILTKDQISAIEEQRDPLKSLDLETELSIINSISAAEYKELHQQRERRWIETIPIQPLNKRELKVLRSLITWGVDWVGSKHVGECGPDTNDRLSARGFIETRDAPELGRYQTAYRLTEAGLAAARKLME